MVVAAATAGHAQQRVRAELAPIVNADGVRAGQQVRAALQIRLPEGYHVNSNKPRDETLIPIVLTVTPPAGVTVTEIVYPSQPISSNRAPISRSVSSSTSSPSAWR